MTELNFSIDEAKRLFNACDDEYYIACKKYIQKYIFQIELTSTHVVFKDNKPVLISTDDLTADDAKSADAGDLNRG